MGSVILGITAEERDDTEIAVGTAASAIQNASLVHLTEDGRLDDFNPLTYDKSNIVGFALNEVSENQELRVAFNGTVQLPASGDPPVGDLITGRIYVVQDATIIKYPSDLNTGDCVVLLGVALSTSVLKLLIRRLDSARA